MATRVTCAASTRQAGGLVMLARILMRAMQLYGQMSETVGLFFNIPGLILHSSSFFFIREEKKR